MQKIVEQEVNTFLFTANGILKFLFEEHDCVEVVTYQQDLKDIFPEWWIISYTIQ